MNWLLEQLAKEWAVIKQAPISFAVVCGLSLLASFLLLRWVYQERLSARDDMLSYYREKMGLAPADKTRYSGLRNSALRAETLALVAKIRALAEQDRADGAQTVAEQQEYRAAKTEEERHQLWQRGIARSSARNAQFVATYNQQFKNDVILLRDEMLLRLPKDKREPFRKPAGSLSSDYVVNSMMMIFLADELERMAKLLPE